MVLWSKNLRVKGIESNVGALADGVVRVVFHGFQSYGLAIVLKLCSEKITLAFGTVQFIGGVADVTHECELKNLIKSIVLWFSGLENLRV